MGGFGGAIKNISIGFASGMSTEKSGKLNIGYSEKLSIISSFFPKIQILEN